MAKLFALHANAAISSSNDGNETSFENKLKYKTYSFKPQIYLKSKLK